MKKYNKRRYKSRSATRRMYFYMVFFLLLFIGIGYSYLQSTLSITGTTKISKNNWDVHFENLSSTDNTKVSITNDTTVTLNVTLNPGDSFEYTVDAVNNGTIDAKIGSITPITVPSAYQNVIEYSLNYDSPAEGEVISVNDVLRSGKKEPIKFTIRYKGEDELDSDVEGATLNLNFTIGYVQADSNITEVKHKVITIPANRTVDTLQVGDEICISTECFNFIRYDGNNIVMLSKYNLKVGNIYERGSDLPGRYSSSDTGYGLQSSDAKGIVSGASTFNGTVVFSATNYWSSITTYPADVYDNTYKTEPDFTGDGFNTTGYSIAYYVEEYKKALEEMGATIQSARLLTYSEATDSSIGCDGTSSYSCPTTGFITNTSFWLGSAFDIDRKLVWIVESYGGFWPGQITTDSRYGARPVIVISKSEV